jgi:hypothetical protein
MTGFSPAARGFGDFGWQPVMEKNTPELTQNSALEWIQVGVNHSFTT